MNLDRRLRWPSSQGARVAILALAYFLTARLGLDFTLGHQHVTAVWPPAGIALAALLLWGYKVWPGILIGALFAHISVAGTVTAVSGLAFLGIAAGDTLQGLMGAWLINRLVPQGRAFERASGLFAFAAAAVASTLVGATLGAVSLSLAGVVERSALSEVWITRWVGHVSGDLILAPPLLLWIGDPRLRWKKKRALEVILLSLTATLAALCVFTWVLPPNPPHLGLAFLCTPPLLWTALRFGPRETATLMLPLSVIAVWGALHGLAAGTQPPPKVLLEAELYLVVTSAVMLALAAEVSRRRSQEEALGQQAETLREHSQILDLGTVLVRDMNDRITRWSAGAERLYGFTQAEALGSVSHSLLRTGFAEPELRDQVRAKLLSLGRWEGELRHKTRDGREVLVASLQVLHRDQSGAPAAILEVNNDITPLKQAEDERARLLEREQAARAEAERANRLKDEFLATVSHELRTPLTAVLGWARMLRRTELDDEARAQALEVIERNARAQAKLIEELLDVSRIISGKLRLRIGPVEVPGVVRAAIETSRPAAEAKGVEIGSVVELPSRTIFADAERLQQVLCNLLSNAIKFTPKGGRAEVRACILESEVAIEVSDTGEGIRAEFLPHLFDPFRQGDASAAREHGGLGLGLTIVRRIMDLHGGTVGVASAGPGWGATFTIRLPLAAGPLKTPDARDGAGRASEASDLMPTLSGIRVLVVEDDADTRNFLSTVLNEYNASVTAVASAQQALAALDAGSPHVIVSDIGLSGQDGYSLMRQIRARGPSAGGDVPALALTAYARVEDRREAMAAGFQIHMVKPIDPEVLARAIARLARPKVRLGGECEPHAVAKRAVSCASVSSKEKH